MTSRVPFSSPRGLRGRRAGIGILAAASLVGVAALSGVVATTASAATGDDAYDRLITHQDHVHVAARSPSTTGPTAPDDPEHRTLRKPGCALVSPAADPVVATASGAPGHGRLQQRLHRHHREVGQRSGVRPGQLPQRNREALTIDLAGKHGERGRARHGGAEGRAHPGNHLREAATRPRPRAPSSSRAARLSWSDDGAGRRARSFICNVATSSAPNSNITDNCRWLFGGLGPFDVVELKALRGQFSLEGGADGVVPTRHPASRPDVPGQRVVLQAGRALQRRQHVDARSPAPAGSFPSGSVKRYENAGRLHLLRRRADRHGRQTRTPSTSSRRASPTPSTS